MANDKIGKYEVVREEPPKEVVKVEETDIDEEESRMSIIDKELSEKFHDEHDQEYEFEW